MAPPFPTPYYITTVHDGKEYVAVVQRQKSNGYPTNMVLYSVKDLKTRAKPITVMNLQNFQQHFKNTTTTFPIVFSFKDLASRIGIPYEYTKMAITAKVAIVGKQENLDMRSVIEYVRLEANKDTDHAEYIRLKKKIDKFAVAPVEKDFVETFNSTEAFSNRFAKSIKAEKALLERGGITKQEKTTRNRNTRTSASNKDMNEIKNQLKQIFAKIEEFGSSKKKDERTIEALQSVNKLLSSEVQELKLDKQDLSNLIIRYIEKRIKNISQVNGQLVKELEDDFKAHISIEQDLNSTSGLSANVTLTIGNVTKVILLERDDDEDVKEESDDEKESDDESGVNKNGEDDSSSDEEESSVDESNDDDDSSSDDEEMVEKKVKDDDEVSVDFRDYIYVDSDSSDDEE